MERTVEFLLLYLPLPDKQAILYRTDLYIFSMIIFVSFDTKMCGFVWFGFEIK